MNISIQQEVTPVRTAGDWQPRPAVRDAMQRIATIAVDDHTAFISDRSITIRNHRERTTISVEPVNADTWDGLRIAECITIRTPLTTFKIFDEKYYSIINVFATTGAIVRDADGQDVVITRLPVFEDDDQALADLYTPLIANAALVQVIGPQCGMHHFRGARDEFTSEGIALPGWDEPSRWGSREFEAASEALRQRGAFANAGENGLTVEFPWEPGAMSALLGHRTSLLRIRADQSHPATGNGLFYRLDLPLSLTNDEAQQCAARLNRTEITAVDVPPFFGAWGVKPKSGTLSFGGFWPNVMYRPGTVSNIAFWTWARSQFARAALGNLH